ncbi:hypothetical protein SGPA1_21768 [Streptomyces misionensis JCM 4497]
MANARIRPGFPHRGEPECRVLGRWTTYGRSECIHRHGARRLISPSAPQPPAAGCRAARKGPSILV